MCDPVSITLGIASAAGGIMAKQAASDAQDAAYEENLRASNQAKVDADRQINLQEAQAQEAAAQEQVANDLQTRELLARAVVAGGESGANGNSTLAYQQGIVRKGLEANTMVTQNLGRELAQMNEARLGQESTHTSRINSVSRGAGVGFGDVLGAAAQGAQVGLAAGANYSTIQKNKPNPVPQPQPKGE